MNISACLVTRGDVDMQPILDSLPAEWEKIIWTNGGNIERWVPEIDYHGYPDPASDLAVYGRYAAIEYATHDLIFVQDDDVIVSDPAAIVDAWLEAEAFNQAEHVANPTGHVVLNMPERFRFHYPDSGLVGFGAAFHRDAPRRAFEQFAKGCAKLGRDDPWMPEPGFFNRRADNIFTTLTPRVLVDVPKTDREFASDPGRMWKQPGHTDERNRMIELARQVRDGRQA